VNNNKMQYIVTSPFCLGAAEGRNVLKGKLKGKKTYLLEIRQK